MKPVDPDRRARIYRKAFIGLVTAGVVWSAILTAGSYAGGDDALRPDRPVIIASDSRLASVLAEHPVAGHFQFAAQLRTVLQGGVLEVPETIEIDEFHVANLADVTVVRVDATSVPPRSVLDSRESLVRISGAEVFQDTEFVTQRYEIVVPAGGTATVMRLWVLDDLWIVAAIDEDQSHDG